LTFLLDTNVLSELRRSQRADPAVRQWAGQLDVQQSFISVVTVLEIEHGAVMIAKKDPAFSARLIAWLHNEILPHYDARVLPIDVAVAMKCAQFGQVHANHFADALLAATALVHNLTLVTRNIGDFRDFAVPLVNPWNDPA
jgi:predicted nucleic acid-binding protein